MAGLASAPKSDWPRSRDSDDGCFIWWPIMIFLVFIIFLVIIVLIFARPERRRREPPCDPDDGE